MAFTNDTRDASGKSINDYKADYAAAAARNDAAGMKAANAAANAIRAANGVATQNASNDIAKVQSGGTSGIVSNPSAWDRGDTPAGTATASLVMPGAISPERAAQERQQQELANMRQQLLDQQDSYARILAEQQRAQQAAVQQAVNGLEAQKTTTNDTYNQYFRQAYIDKMNAQKNIDQRLAAQGITGGAAESTLLGLNTSYADALRSMEQGRIRDLEGLDRAITDARLTGDIEGANAAANTIREQTASYSDTLRYLLDQAEAQNVRQNAYDREDAASSRAWAQQLALNALNNGYMPDSDTLEAANMSADYAAAILDAINRQKAQDQADWRAGYGDYGGLNDLGVDTSNLTAQQALQLAAMRRQGTTTTSPSTPRYSQAQAEMALQAALNGDYSGQSVIESYYNMPLQTVLDASEQTSQPQTQTASTGGMNESLFNQEARTIMAYLGQGMVNQAQSRLARIWNSLSASQQQALNNALVNNGYTG